MPEALADLANTLLNLPVVFGAAEHAALIVLALTLPIVLAPVPLPKALAMGLLGLLLGSLWDPGERLPVQRELLGLSFEGELALVPLLVVYGFLLPRIARYALPPHGLQRAGGWPTARPGKVQPGRAWPETAYNALFMPHTLPALLLMRPTRFPAHVVLPVLAWMAVALCIHWGLLPTEHPWPWWGLAVFAAGLVAMACDLPWPPLLAGTLAQGPLEAHLRRALLLGQGDWTLFLHRPTSAGLLLLALLLVVVSLWVRARAARRRTPIQPLG
ncbi:hypothetical protein CCO03_16740 [Comamonas serinivorans]|uniref:Uncharacterized protein n=1 Tax=Comamonas serinivorans TaxID=1082851 RepID=A0A1Y0ER96_9BURK|nr:hypothetical protein [Comamonas serinivorans]ARU06096.1 hypothetical protein CCO03_16740 [Comamonas serinivorans]